MTGDKFKFNTSKLLKELKGSRAPFFPRMADGSGKRVCPVCFERINGSDQARQAHFKQHDSTEEVDIQRAMRIARGDE